MPSAHETDCSLCLGGVPRVMRFARQLLCLGVAVALGASAGWAQVEEGPLQAFGYFQVTYQGEHRGGIAAAGDNTSFTVQQLNLLLQKDLAPSLSALVNFELVNSYSSNREWGALNLEEAWLRYRQSRRLSVKVGLHIPPFGKLNEIKNRTPLLPYVVRPPVYEASFEELVALDEFVPNRAYVQAYGFLPVGAAKLDYAAYVGNSANVARRGEGTVSGRDTTLALLYGARLGVRYMSLEAGLSATLDHVNALARLEPLYGLEPGALEGVLRTRSGADLSLTHRRFSFQAEGLRVRYAEAWESLQIARDFAYANLSVRVRDPLQLYAGYWYILEHVRGPAVADRTAYRERARLSGPTAGATYDLSGRVALKVQGTPLLVRDYTSGLDVDTRGELVQTTPVSASYRLIVVNAAVSVFF